MQKIKRGLIRLSLVSLGFLMTFIGISQLNATETTVNDIKDRISFGNQNSPVEVYFFTDWFCASCRKIEPEIEEIFPHIQSQVAFYFIDYPIHKKSLNFSPYNLAFLIYNKPQYFQARQALIELTERTQTPTDEDVEQEAQKWSIPFKKLSSLDVKAGLQYFNQMIHDYALYCTPTIVITDPLRNRVVKLQGRGQISKEKVLETIQKMSREQQ